MFRNYLSAALGNIGRNGLYAGITIVGLAVSFAAAILIGLFLRDEASFDRSTPGHERVYRVSTQLTFPGARPEPYNETTSTVAGYLKLDFAEVERVARLEGGETVLKRDDVLVREPLLWADPDFFKVMPLPVLAGDPIAALAAPDGLVLTRAAARRYFGQDAPIGRVLMVNPGLEVPGLPAQDTALLTAYHPMRVMAVLKDLPSNTHLRAQLYASGRAPFSLLALSDRHPSPFNLLELTYVQLKPGASVAAMRERLTAFADRRYANPATGRSSARFLLLPLSSLHFSAAKPVGSLDDGTRPPGDPRFDAGVAAEGVLIVLIAAINFVTLMTARASRRAVEVGVRKAVGATRADLIVQFMGEALIYVAVAMATAVVLAELVLPSVNGFLGRSLSFDYLRDPGLVVAIVGAALLTVLIAGLYPAFALSAFRPATALKGGVTAPAGAARARQALVAAQFAIVIGLLLVTATLYRQTQFALHDALRLDTSQMVQIRTACRSAFRQELEGLAGVQGVTCASVGALAVGSTETTITLPDRSQRNFGAAPVDVGFFELHGLKPIAGRFFSDTRGEDVVLRPLNAGPDRQPSLVVNESAARLLGFPDPVRAIGQTVPWVRLTAFAPGSTPMAHPSRIVGVAPDFTFGSIRAAIRPTIYYVDPADERFIVVKLDGRAIPESLKAMQDLWRRLGHDRPLAYVFESAAVQSLYGDVITQGVALAVCAGLAVVIACLGLFALAAFVTERRTKEIGVRKAMGASAADVVGLLLWQFTQPVLWANLIAWPAAFWVMDFWLHGFAYRVDLPLWLFLAASLVAALIAWATVSFQSLMAARAKPATALRYE